MASKVTISIQCSEFLLQRSLNTIEYSEKKKKKKTLLRSVSIILKLALTFKGTRKLIASSLKLKTAERFAT